jgi:hypothetical protein
MTAERLTSTPAGSSVGKDEAKIRAAALGGMEHGILAIGDYAAAMAVLVSGRSAPPLDLSVGPRRPEAGDLRTAVGADAASISRA